MEIKKIFIVLALLVVSATALILAGIYIADNVSFSADGLTGKQRAEAANITLSNYLVARLLDSANATYELGDIKSPDSGYYTYSNVSRSLAVVPIHIKNDYAEINLSVTVDLKEKKTVSVYFDERSPDITYKQQMDAIMVALNDEYVKGWMKDLGSGDAGMNNQRLYYDGYIIGGALPSGFSEYGYVDPFGFYVDVPIQLDSPISPAVKYLLVTVNLADNKAAIRKEYCGEALMGSTVNATIPPGQSFYREYYTPMNNITISNYIRAGRGYISIWLTIGQQPADISIRPYVVDNENLLKLRNGSSFSELKDASHNISGNRWSIFVPAKTEFYLVLKNEDTKRDVNVTIPYRPF